jgi:DNA invertase Pin-like site-specific DNA recombinase
MNAVIYARYSSDNQREESIEGQVRECREYAEKNGMDIIGVYTDRAFSAKTDNRPEFQQLIKDSANKSFEAVLVWKLDRFARNRYDSAKYKYVLKKNGVRVISATETISEGAEGILLETMLEGMAEYYSVELAEKVKRGQTENALKCKYNGGGIPFGLYVDEEQHLKPDPVTAPLVKEMFVNYSEGMKLQQIVDKLNEKGVVNSRGNPLNVNSVGRILHNRIYIGEYKHSDVVVPNGIPAIISEELFDTVQEMLNVNRRSIAKHKAAEEYLLTTKLYCGKCKNQMFGESGKNHAGIIYRYYKCADVKRHGGCDKKSVKKEWIEDLVVNDTVKMLLDDKLIEYIADKIIALVGTEDPLLPAYRSQVDDVQKSISNLIKAMEQGIITESTKQRLEELEAQKKKLNTEIAALESKKPNINKEMILAYLKSFRNYDPDRVDHRRKLINHFVNKIYLYDDKVIITYNFKNVKKTISFKEVEGAIDSSESLSAGAPEKKQVNRPAFFVHSFRNEPVTAVPSVFASQLE